MLLLASSVCGLFKWRQFEPEVILLAVGWYLRFSLSYRDVEELLAERGLLVDHVTVWRWVQRYAPEIQRRLRLRLRPTNDSWRVDETYIRVKGKWVYLYRAVDSSGATIDFLLSAKRDAAAAERFLGKALGGENHPAPRVINTDEHAGYPPAIVRLKSVGALEENCRHRPVQYLNNVLEQDHRAIKRRVRASQHFRSFWGAWRTIAGYEAIHMIRKGQACGSVGLLHHFILGLFAATNSARLQSCNTAGGSARPRKCDQCGGISPDKHWLVTSSKDNTPGLWDLDAKDPAASQVVLRHEGEVIAMGFSPDNHWLVTGTNDGMVRLWDLSAKDPAANPIVLRGHENAVNTVGFSPDNHWLVTGSSDKTARLWPLQVKDLIDLARITVGRNFATDEWQLYFPGEPCHFGQQRGFDANTIWARPRQSGHNIE